jgi:hypothetical protein
MFYSTISSRIYRYVRKIRQPTDRIRSDGMNIPGTSVTVTLPSRKYEFKKTPSFIGNYFIWLNNLGFIERRFFFKFEVLLFAACWTLPSQGGGTPPPPIKPLGGFAQPVRKGKILVIFNISL